MTWLAWLWGVQAWAGLVDDLERCLRRNDVPCADGELTGVDPETLQDAEVLAQVAQVDFYAGRYPLAAQRMERAVALGFPDPEGDAALFRRTLHVTAGWVEESQGRFLVRHRPGLDDLLVEEAFRVLEASERNLAPLLGGPPPGRTALEIFPDGRSFTAASSLMREDVETTGVVAISRWSRLLVTSPRTFAWGYDWGGTVAHEYIHLVVSHQTEDRAPVWLQEAIAKYLDNRWADGTDGFRLPVRSEGYLATALAEDNLVSFEEMHPSLAKLDTAERAALAYAQLATLMAYSFQQGGEEVLRRVLPRVRAGEDPRVALAVESGYADFPTFEAAWRRWLEASGLVAGTAPEPPVVLDGGDDVQADPLLARRADLSRYLLLGDHLTQLGEHEAALIEYNKAVDPEETESPLLSHRRARSALSLGREEEALQVLDASLALYPEHYPNLRLRGQVLEKLGDPRGAVRAWQAALGGAPFDLSLHQALAKAYRTLGEATLADKHLAAERLIRRGGRDDPAPVLHEEAGPWEPPSYQPQPGGASAEEAARPGPAPPIEATLLDGSPLVGPRPGEVWVVDFWATWCGPCRESMPALSQLHQELQAEFGERVVVVGLTDEPEGTVRRFLAGRPVAYPVALDAGGRTKDRFAVRVLPTAVVIDRRGQVVAVVHGGGEAALAEIRQAARAAAGEGE